MSTKPRSTRRVTRGAFVAASRSAGSRSSDSGRLRSPWLSGVRSYDDFGSRPMDWEPASPAVDRRLYIPSPPSGPSSRYVRRYVEPASRVSGRPARVVAPPPRKRLKTLKKALPQASWKGLLFAQPAGVQVCVQRGVRREVLHARGVAGSRVAPPRRGSHSNVRCR